MEIFDALKVPVVDFNKWEQWALQQYAQPVTIFSAKEVMGLTHRKHERVNVSKSFVFALDIAETNRKTGY